MTHVEFALIKGICIGFTVDSDEDYSREIRLFLVFLYIGIIAENE